MSPKARKKKNFTLYYPTYFLDSPFYKGKHTPHVFNAVAKAIAALSFVPGGITVLGNHWESSFN